MHGHENIIVMRLQGFHPPWVFINDYPCQTDWFDYEEHATVCTAGDEIRSLDLRYLVDLQVNVSSACECRAKELAARALAAGAITVAACHIQTDWHPYEQSGWCEIFNKKGE